jgi:hypothetical protein
MAASDPTRLARDALERVCSGSDPSAAVGVYSAHFRDHVKPATTRATTASGGRSACTSWCSAMAICAFASTTR